MEKYLYSSVVGLPVASVRDQKKIGNLRQFILDFSKLEIIGFLIKQNFWSANQFLPFNSVVDIEQAGVLINDSESLSPPHEIVRVDKILKNKKDFFSLAVMSSEGHYLGRPFDFSFEKTSGIIEQIYITQLWRRRIFHRNKIKKITTRTIIITNEKELAGAMQTA